VTAEEGGSLFKREASVEEIYGRWINTAYSEYDCLSAKMVISKDKFYAYPFLSSPEYSYMGTQGKYVVKDSWSDLKGNSYFKLRLDSPIWGTNYELWKISESGLKLEIASRAFEYPTEIVKDSYRVAYYIYYRQ
jgi:hypothetical protein